MHARHDGTHALRHLVRHFAGRTLISPAEGHKGVGSLQIFGVRVIHVELAHDVLSDRVASHRKTACKDAPLFDEYQVRRAGTDVHHQSAAGQIIIIVPDRVVERHRRHIHQIRVKPGFADRIRHLFDHLRLDGGQQHIHFAGRAADELVVPNHLVNGKRHILLCLVENDLIDPLRIHRRKLHITREDRLARNGHQRGPGLYAGFAHHAPDCLHDECAPIDITLGIHTQ